MSVPPSSFDPRRFRSTVPYYARFRLPYPDPLIARVIGLAGLEGADRMMDLGCGPGLLAIPFARAGMRVLAVDPEPEMLELARDAAQRAGVAISLRLGSSFELPTDAAPFKLVTIGRAFHWMDREATLRALDPLIVEDGALALFDDEHPRTAENGWRFVLRDIGDRFGRAQSPHVMEARRADYRTHEALLLDSAFSVLEGASVFVRRQVSADDIVGLAHSLSTLSAERLGDRANAFESELRARLAELSPDGQFTEIAELKALVAKRPNPGIGNAQRQ
jgi:SAM-dependent methyltransferase